MASTYNLEPPPTAKVILSTTTGDLTLELFAKQTPLASRNFLQHCLDGYYNGTLFHRLVPGFIIQGGDPSGTGSGGISAINNGEGFGDEVHTRLKFNRRGLLGMAKGEDGSYGSQFFLTLGSGPEVQGLQGACTMFGRIEGDTIYNLMKMTEAEMADGEGSERPLYPTKITGTEVLVNPFEDMIARAREAPRTKEEGGKKEMKKRKKPAGKNVLSFGGEEVEEEMAAPVMKKVKANPKLVSVGMEEPEKLNNTKMPEAPAMPLKIDREDIESSDDEPEERPNTSALDRTNAEIAALKASMKRTVAAAPKEKERPKNVLEAMIPSTSTRGRRRGKVADERGAIDMFKAFKQRLEELPAASTAGADEDHPVPGANGTAAKYEVEADEEEANLCDLHFIPNCQSCRSWDDDAEVDAVEADGEGDGWMAHTLTFEKDLKGKDLEFKRKMAEIQVIDPRAKAREIKEEGKKKGKMRA
ncbi:Peptidyl-prolyl isomerase cwc27 [Elasticomyces elasticus]|nr:Peptidyl-prolyl isomerase cwc27 [Elasticomyces elasticus]